MSHQELTYCVTLNCYLSNSTPLQERLSLWEFSIDLHWNSNLKPLEDLQSALNNLSTPELVFIGDFNLSEFDWTNNTPLTGSEPYILLIHIIQDNFLTQLVDQPTREGNILDLVLTSNEDLIDNLYVGEPFSDHSLVTLQLSNIPYVPRQTHRQVYSYKKADWTHLTSLLEVTKWDCALWDDDINLIWCTWKDLLFAAVDECTPKIISKKKPNAPWITKELLILCRKKKLLYKKLQESEKKKQRERLDKISRFEQLAKRKCNQARRKHIGELA